MEHALIFLGLAFMANKVVSTFKNLTTAASRGAAYTQLVVWAVAIALTFAASEAELTEAYVLPGTTQPLGAFDGWSLLLVGLMAGSTGSVLWDFRKAFDNTDSAAEPSLFPLNKGGGE
jgi:hypothetical protein